MHPLLIGILFTVIAVIIYFVHQKAQHEEVEKTNMFKVSMLSFIVSVASVYTYMYVSDSLPTSDLFSTAKVESAVATVMDQDILTGNPNF
jgi:uncharacterized membrane protein